MSIFKPGVEQHAAPTLACGKKHPPGSYLTREGNFEREPEGPDSWDLTEWLELGSSALYRDTTRYNQGTRSIGASLTTGRHLRTLNMDLTKSLAAG